jgi:hypothetical protein
MHMINLVTALQMSTGANARLWCIICLLPHLWVCWECADEGQDGESVSSQMTTENEQELEKDSERAGEAFAAAQENKAVRRREEQEAGRYLDEERENPLDVETRVQTSDLAVPPNESAIVAAPKGSTGISGGLDKKSDGNAQGGKGSRTPRQSPEGPSSGRGIEGDMGAAPGHAALGNQQPTDLDNQQPQGDFLIPRRTLQDALSHLSRYREEIERGRIIRGAPPLFVPRSALFTTKQCTCQQCTWINIFSIIRLLSQ